MYYTRSMRNVFDAVLGAFTFVGDVGALLIAPAAHQRREVPAGVRTVARELLHVLLVEVSRRGRVAVIRLVTVGHLAPRRRRRRVVVDALEQLERVAHTQLRVGLDVGGGAGAGKGSCGGECG